MNTTKVIVIGTGPSGIAAGTKLLEYGFQDVILLEAEDRIGGRIHTIPFADNVVDLGAQWCHGEKDNVVYEMASKHNLVAHTEDNFYLFQCIRSNKEIVPIKLLERFKSIIDNIVEVTANTDLLTYKGSVGDYIDEKYFEALKAPENSDIDPAIAKELLEHFKRYENSVDGCETVNDLSAKGFLEYSECEGDQALTWKETGYHSILRVMMQSNESNALGVLDKRIKLGKSVNKISWNEDGSKIQVQCKDGEIFEADHVIVTVSLGVLKDKHSTLFHPKLPVEKIRAIETMGIGTVNKIFLEFSTQFWPNNWNGFSTLWREEDLAEIRGTNRAWLEDVYGFYRVAHQPRILSGWVVGANARHMETLTDDEIYEGSMYILKRFLEMDIPKPVNFKTTGWYKNENFRGSYSYQSVRAEEVNAKPSDLASPLESSTKKPLVLFAGEATSDHHFSTVHGAIETGWREAKRLADLYKS
ncbi:spermine oxidase-like [Episyrphus balteatus]|uniref:spermine oxidase-like n=1 Tax=Episyrphus balteatus TaxID=286459 RepID=UPI0024855591|nr:spermine oxidase-like [Episyrphus balteatus]